MSAPANVIMRRGKGPIEMPASGREVEEFFKDRDPRNPITPEDLEEFNRQFNEKLQKDRRKEEEWDYPYREESAILAKGYNKGGEATKGTEYDALFQTAGEKYGVEPSILRAIASVESNFNPQAVGPKTRSGRAQGMMQFVPATARAYGLEDPFNPEQSVDAAARLMRDLQKQYKGDVGKALEAYNGGPRLVGKSKQTAKYREMVLARAGRAPSDEIPEPAQPIIGARSVPKELKQGQMYGEAPKMPAAAPRQVTMGTIEGMPPSYRTAFALQYLADTEPDDDPEAKANDLLARLDELEAEDAPLASSKLASLFAEQAAQPMNAFQTIQSKRNPQKQQKKRALPSMQVVQGFAEGGDVSEQMTVGTLPEDAKDYKEVLKGLKKSLGDIRRGIQYAPADLVGAPVDIANMVLEPFGLGSEKPFMGSEYLIDKGVEAGIYEKPSGTATETLSRLGAGIISPTSGARTVGRGIASLEESFKGPPEGAIKPRGGIIDPGLVDPKVTPSTLLAEPRQVTRARETAQAKLKDAMGRDIDPEKRDALVNFIDSKYSKYVTTDLGTEADPVRQTMKQGKTVPSSDRVSEKDIYDQLANVQSLRTTGKPVEESVFFPANIEEAERSFERAYDRATNIKPRMLVRATDLDEDSREILARSASRIDVYNLIKRTAANEVYGSSLPLKVGVFAKMDPPLAIQKIVRNYVDQVKKNAQLMEQEGNPDGLETLLDQTNIELLSDNKYDALNDTLKRSVNKELVFSTETQSFVGEHNPERIIETLAAVPTDKLYKLNFKEAYELGTKLLEPVRKYEQSIAMAEAKQTPPKEALFYFTNPVLDLKKGEASLQWVQLENSKAARMEGAMMGHSVGDYDKLKPYNLGGKEAFDAGNAKIFSLRTERGVPKVTLEYGKPVKDLAFYFNEPDEDLVRQVQGLSNSAPLDYLQETFDLLKKKGLRFPQGQMQSYFRDRNGKDLDQRIAINWDRLQKYYEKGNPFDYKISNDIDVNGDPVIIVTSPDDTKVYNPIDKSSVRYAKGGLVSKPLYDRA